MSRAVEMISPDDSVQDAARKMADEDFGVLPVAELDGFVGVVTDSRGSWRSLKRIFAPEFKCSRSHLELNADRP